jgi:hypothetical protein
MTLRRVARAAAQPQRVLVFSQLFVHILITYRLHLLFRIHLVSAPIPRPPTLSSPTNG